jgi:uncharacterized membrane protein YedE/YeeE
MNLIDWLRQPWPWYVTGPLIGLMVPLLLIIGNKTFGISSSLRHACAACFPANIGFFKYDWKKEKWNLFFAAGIIMGGIFVALFLQSKNPVNINPKLVNELAQYGIQQDNDLMPASLYNWNIMFTMKGLIMFVLGGFLVGFGTRWAGGCTSGHSIMGLSNLQLPSLIATICFFIGGALVANFIIPLILKL